MYINKSWGCQFYHRKNKSYWWISEDMMDWVGNSCLPTDHQQLIVNVWKCLYQVRVITVFTVFRSLTDFVCLYNYEFWLSLCKIVRSSVILLLPLFVDYELLEIELHGSWSSSYTQLRLVIIAYNIYWSRTINTHPFRIKHIDKSIPLINNTHWGGFHSRKPLI
jgi:hypothetical protein